MGPSTSLLSVTGDWIGYPESVLLFAVLALAGVGTGVLFLVALVAYSRRRTRTYGIITVAIGMLFFRSVVGLGTVAGLVPMAVHHLMEHGLDFVIAALILYAVYASGGEERITGSE